MGKIIADPTGGVIIGIDMVHYAVMISDEKDASPEYDAISPLPNAKSMQVASSDSIQTEYYDNAPKVTAVSKGEKKATFQKSEFSDDDLSIFLGCEIIDGVLCEGGDDSPPYIALGFRAKTTKGRRYVWLPKGMMLTPSINAATQDANITFQNETIEGTFIARVCDNQIRLQENVSGAKDTDEFAAQWFSKETLERLYKKPESEEEDED